MANVVVTRSTPSQMYPSPFAHAGKKYAKIYSRLGVSDYFYIPIRKVTVFSCSFIRFASNWFWLYFYFVCQFYADNSYRC